VARRIDQGRTRAQRTHDGRGGKQHVDHHHHPPRQPRRIDILAADEHVERWAAEGGLRRHSNSVLWNYVLYFGINVNGTSEPRKPRSCCIATPLPRKPGLAPATNAA